MKRYQKFCDLEGCYYYFTLYLILCYLWITCPEYTLCLFLDVVVILGLLTIPVGIRSSTAEITPRTKRLAVPAPAWIATSTCADWRIRFETDWVLCPIWASYRRLQTSTLSSTMSYQSQQHSRFSVLSTSSLSSVEHLSPVASSTRFSLPSAPSVNTTLGTPKSAVRPNIYDRNLNKSRSTEVSAAAFAFLFSEVVQYTQKRVTGIADLERRFPRSFFLWSIFLTILQTQYSRVSCWYSCVRINELEEWIVFQSTKTRNSLPPGSHVHTYSGVENTLWQARRCDREECWECRRMYVPLVL